jgi:hypothetical protein
MSMPGVQPNSLHPTWIDWMGLIVAGTWIIAILLVVSLGWFSLL